MIWWLSVIVAGILLSATMKGADFAGRWLWANRSKAAGALNVRVPAWSLAVLTLLFCVLLVAPWRGCELPSVPWTIGGQPPFATDKLSVLIVEETRNRPNYTPDQLNVVTATDSKSVKAAVEKAGGRFDTIDLDTADNLQNAHEWVKAAMQVKRGDELPWVLAATPKSGFSIPLKTEAEVLAKVEGLK